MGGGKQWRPVVHLNDVAKAFMMLLKEDRKKINGQIFNVGSNEQNYQVHALAHMIRGCFENVELEVVPEDEDKRTYHVCFDKIAKELGFVPDETPVKAARQIRKALQSGEVAETLSTKTVEFYKYLIEANRLLENIKLKGRLF
jgi:nucleoside-diphosphate-sugar epimerase